MQIEADPLSMDGGGAECPRPMGPCQELRGGTDRRIAGILVLPTAAVKSDRIVFLSGGRGSLGFRVRRDL